MGRFRRQPPVAGPETVRRPAVAAMECLGEHALFSIAKRLGHLREWQPGVGNRRPRPAPFIQQVAEEQSLPLQPPLQAARRHVQALGHTFQRAVTQLHLSGDLGAHALERTAADFGPRDRKTLFYQRVGGDVTLLDLPVHKCSVEG